TDIKELSVELYTMNFEQVNHLWSTLGGKYMPSVLYKVRNLSISEHLILGEARRIEEIVVHPGLIARRGGGSP
ncbi:MAG TPA: Pvc16 family protein, partial [Polyangiaceae bacterium]|nr:Pvc16 family protein [Polyangiaceae bacterium]